MSLVGCACRFNADSSRGVDPVEWCEFHQRVIRRVAGEAFRRLERIAAELDGYRTLDVIERIERIINEDEANTAQRGPAATVDPALTGEPARVAPVKSEPVEPGRSGAPASMDQYPTGRPPALTGAPEWPYGPPEYHEPCCRLFAGAAECDCKASDASDAEWGRGA